MECTESHRCFQGCAKHLSQNLGSCGPRTVTGSGSFVCFFTYCNHWLWGCYCDHSVDAVL